MGLRLRPTHERSLGGVPRVTTRYPRVHPPSRVSPQNRLFMVVAGPPSLRPSRGSPSVLGWPSQGLQVSLKRLRPWGARVRSLHRGGEHWVPYGTKPAASFQLGNEQELNLHLQGISPDVFPLDRRCCHGHARCRSVRRLLTYRMRHVPWHSPRRALPCLPDSGTCTLRPSPCRVALGLHTSDSTIPKAGPRLPLGHSSSDGGCGWARGSPRRRSSNLLARSPFDEHRFGHDYSPAPAFGVTTAREDDGPSRGRPRLAWVVLHKRREGRDSPRFHRVTPMSPHDAMPPSPRRSPEGAARRMSSVISKTA